MTQKLKQLLAVASALMIAAPVGSLYASGVTLSDPGQDKPKDCKMNPEDPRCKDEKKG